MSCCQRCPENKLQDLRDYIAGGARFWFERAYGETMIRKARERMAEPARG